MISKTTKRFRDALAALPQNIQRKAASAYQLFRDNPNHHRLQYKKVHPNKPVYSVRIDIKYRAVGAVDNDIIIWFWVGKHSEYEELLKRV